MNIVIYKTLEKKLKKEWESLWKSSPFANYVNSPYWFAATLESFNYDTYQVIALYDEGKLVAITGLIKEKRYGVPVYTLPPGDFVCGIPLLLDLKNKKQTSIFIKELEKLNNVFLDNIPEQFVTLLQKNTAKFAVTRYGINMYFDYKKDNNGHVIIANRKSMLRRVKKLEDKFVLKSFHGDSKEAFEIVFQIDKNSRKQIRGYNAFSGKPIQNFYNNLAKQFKENFYINILYFGKEPILYEMGFKAGSTYYASQIAFDEKYRQYAPGKVLEVRLIEALEKDGVTQIDLGSGDSSIKRLLTEEYRQLYKVIISKNILSKFYLRFIYGSKNYIFDFIKKHIAMYKVYRNTKNFIFMYL